MRSSARLRSAACILVGLLSACGGETPQATTGVPPAVKPATPPTALEARELIGASPEFGDYEFTNAAISIPMHNRFMNAISATAFHDLARDGWLGFDGSGAVVLSAKAKGDKRFLVRPNGFLDVVPLAKKEMGDVSAVRPNANGEIDVDFTWKWIPNEVGRALKSGPAHDQYVSDHAATATLMRDGDAWTVLRIRATK